jgi:DNA-binding NarL/FixJ family response regulator
MPERRDVSDELCPRADAFGQGLHDEIAGLMQASRHTVQTYVKRSYRKLHVHSKVEALSEARRLRLLSE